MQSVAYTVSVRLFHCFNASMLFSVNVKISLRQLAIVSYNKFDTKITTRYSILVLNAHIILVIIVNFSRTYNDNRNTWRDRIR